MITEDHKVTAIMKLIYAAVVIVLLPNNPIPVECFELQAFKEHLDLNHLRHGVIIRNTETVWPQRIHEHFVVSLLKDYFINFVNLNLNSKFDFNELCYHLSARIGVFLRISPSADVKKTVQFLISASVSEKFNYSCSWFIVMEDETENPLTAMRSWFGHLNVMINADITVGIVKRNNTLDLYDIYNVCPKCGIPLNVHLKGTWKLYKGFQLLNCNMSSFVSRRNNFQNISINVATALIDKSPLVNSMEYLENSKDSMQNDTMQRKTYILLKTLEPLYNFRFALQISDTWGVFTNNTWTGVAALLADRKIDFTLCPLRYKFERLSVLTYSPSLHVEKIRFLLRHPKRASIRNIFFEPLDDTVWWCVLALIAITTLLLVIHIHIEYQLYWQLNFESNGRWRAERHLDFILLTILEAIFMQGPSPELFRNNSTRLLLVSVSVFAVLLMQFYGAFIVSSLLSEPPRTINNLAALYNSTLKIGMENISYNFEIFKGASNQLARTIYKQRICNQRPNNIMTLEEGVQHIAKGRFAFHVSVDRAYRLLKSMLTQSEFCELQEITFNTPFVAGIGITRGSPYKKFITTAIIKFRESSVLQYNDNPWKINNIDCSAIHDAEVEVDLVHFAPVLVFLATSAAIALGMFVGEWAYRKLKYHKCAIMGHAERQSVDTKQRANIAQRFKFK